MMSFLSAVFIVLIVASAHCQIPDGCTDCGLPNHPNCEFGDCTETCFWCKIVPEDIVGLENMINQMEILNQMA